MILRYANNISILHNILTVWTPTDFDDFYAWSEYREIKQKIADSPVLSVGLDPMRAAMSDIKTIDGYYPMYPLSYKKKFREVIQNALIISGKKDYYDNWGSRIYAFYPERHPELINFCKAYELGARYIISSEKIISQELDYEYETKGPSLIQVYRIKYPACFHSSK